MTKELEQSLKELNDSMKPYRLRNVENINEYFRNKKGMNLFESIEKTLSKDEIIEACLIGEYQPDYLLQEENFDPKFKELIQSQPLNKLLSWNDAKQYLDYYFDPSFGAEDLWNKNKDKI